MELTKKQLKELLPKNPYIDQWHEALSQLLPDYEINTPQRIAAFIAQCAHESGGFMVLKENLNYRPATLRKIFPKYFPTDALAEAYCNMPKKQEAIANRVYASRMGNGPEESGDGFRFCGRGLIQLTGRDNYTRFAEALNMSIEDTVRYLETPNGAVASAGWFWDNNKLNQFCDKDDFVTLTKRINGGTIGLEDRKHHYHLALQHLGAH